MSDHGTGSIDQGHPVEYRLLLLWLKVVVLIISFGSFLNSVLIKLVNRLLLVFSFTSYPKSLCLYFYIL